MNNTIRLLETLYTNSRVTLDFVMWMPEGTYVNKDRDGVRFDQKPILTLKCKKTKENEEFYDFNKAHFRITVNNYYQTMEFFNTLMKWLFDDEFNDLFMLSPTNKLMFNADYKTLKAHVEFYTRDRTQVMSAIPSLISYDGKAYEGVHLFINTTDYRIPLTFKEVGILFSILSSFNFSAEVTKLLTMYTHALRNDRIRPSISETRTPFD